MDATKRRRRASAEALLAVLEQMGSGVRSPADVPEAIREREAAVWSRPLEPVMVAREGKVAVIDVRLPWRLRDSPVELDLTFESGNSMGVVMGPSPRRRFEPTDVGGRRYASLSVPIAHPDGLEPGYHRIRLVRPRIESSGLLIVAPPQCPSIDGRLWGAFMPLYAIRSARDWGCGDFTDLEQLLWWVEELGGAHVGTLPLLASFHHVSADPSPYSPVSRLFWNEVFIDVTGVPELERSREARELMASPAFRREIDRVHRSRLVDYGAVASLKRRVLEHLARSFFRGPINERRTSFAEFAIDRPDLLSYATFRAAAERYGAGWHAWPAGSRGGRIPTRDADPQLVRYHQYVQLVAEDQLGEISGARGSVPAVRRPGTGLYLDFPLGVSPGGYDTWRYRDAFAHDASVGAPPDVFFSRGQDWGFPPTHPERQREDGYTYLRAALRNLLRHAGSLRIDHVMGLHRLYWVPPGSDARDGVYVQYRAAELYAILALESHRAGAAVVGEDLGTVPRYVQQAMARHGILRSYVLQLAPLAGSVGRPPPLSVASLNTHDLPTFAGFWQGLDIEDRLAKGLLDPKDVRKERSERARQRKLLRGALREAGAARDAHPGEAIAAALRYLAASPSRMVVVNLEDLWGEAEPQNRPGTGLDQPNWRRKASRPLESFRSDEAVLGTLKEIDRLRRRQETTRGSP